MIVKPRCVAIIQGRMAASRLPGKVLLDISGKPMLVRVLERTRRAETVGEVLVATTTDPSDDPVVDFCQAHGYICFRGSQYDVLDRYYQAARSMQAEVVVRITADCPVIDPQLIDRTVTEFFQANADLAADRLPPPWHRTYPIGLDVEVCTFQALERAWKETSKPHHREHVMPYLYEEEGRFRTLQVDHEPDYGSLRWTVDTPEDLELVRQIYARFPGRDNFTWQEVLALFEREPELAQINAQVQHKSLTDVDERRAA